MDGRPRIWEEKGFVWTGDPDRPWAEGVAVRNGRILAVGNRDEILALSDADTRVIDQPGRFVAPGFIDNHTHFASAGALLLGVNLLDVADEAGLVLRVREARDRLPADAWLVGGDWGAYEAWAQNSTGGQPAAGVGDLDVPDLRVMAHGGGNVGLGGAAVAAPGITELDQRGTGERVDFSTLGLGVGVFGVERHAAYPARSVPQATAR